MFLDDGAPPLPSLDEPLDVRGTMLLTNALHERLSVEGEGYLQALLERKRAAAAFLPTIGLQPSYLLREETGSQRTRSFDAPVVGEMSVNMVSDPARIEFADVAAVAQLALLLDAQDRLLLDAAQAHYRVVLAERAIVVLENSLAVQQQRVDDAQGRLDAGTVRPLDLSLSQSQAAQTKVALLAARREAIIGRRLLSFYTATELMDQPLADLLDVPEDAPDPVSLRRMALERRADLAAADRTIDAAAAAVRVAYGQYFPQISADLQIFLARDSEPSGLDWTSLIEINLPLFSAGLIEADVRTALSQLREAKLLRSELAREIERQVAVAIDNWIEAAERIEQLHVQVASAAAALEQATGSYNVGLATNLEQVEAQDRLLSAQLQLVSAELDRKTFYLDLRRATGTLHELVGLQRTKSPWADGPRGEDAGPDGANVNEQRDEAAEADDATTG